MATQRHRFYGSNVTDETTTLKKLVLLTLFTQLSSSKTETPSQISLIINFVLLLVLTV